MTHSPSRIQRRLAALFLGIGLTAGVSAEAPHQHGVAQLDIAFDAGTLSIDLDTPLDNLLGFERAPRTPAERQIADAAVARLRSGATLFRIDPAAQCVPASVTLTSAALKLGTTSAPASTEHASHADLEANYQFRCNGSPPAFIDHGLFEAFSRLSRVSVQIATGTAQAKATLTRPAARIALKRGG